MAVKKKVAREVAKTKEKMSQVFNQARESLKLLELLEKETIAKAKTFVRNPLGVDRKKLKEEKITASLRKLGVATQDELEALRLRMDRLEAALAAQSGTTSSTMPNG